MASVFKPRYESMVTRFKSAQQKNLHEQTVKTLSQLLKRPNVTVKRTKAGNVATAVTKKNKVKYVKREVPKSSVAEESAEYYPEVQKRNAPAKKIMLKPRHEYTVVAATNKRKRRIPHREIKSPPPKLPKTMMSPSNHKTEESEVSVQELVRMAEEQGLDDEDLMEILTCPSPVWWEDLENEEHEEKLSRFIEHKIPQAKKRKTSINIQKSRETNDKPTTDSDINDNNLTNDNLGTPKTKKFVQKQSKLENVLGNIRVKKLMDAPPNDESRVKNRKDSASTFSDTSLNEDELLRTLENIEIPVQPMNTDTGRKTIESTKAIDLTTEMKHPKPVKVKRTRRKKPLTRKKKSKYPKSEYLKLKNIKIECNEIDLSEVPTTLPPLTKNPFGNVKIESPRSVDSLTINNIVEFDSISDTNIKFLDEYDEKTEASDTNLSQNNDVQSAEEIDKLKKKNYTKLSKGKKKAFKRCDKIIEAITNTADVTIDQNKSSNRFDEKIENTTYAKANTDINNASNRFDEKNDATTNVKATIDKNSASNKFNEKIYAATNTADVTIDNNKGSNTFDEKMDATTNTDAIIDKNKPSNRIDEKIEATIQKVEAIGTKITKSKKSFLNEYAEKIRARTGTILTETKNAEGDFVTVYRIIPTAFEENLDVEEKIKINLLNKDMKSSDDVTEPKPENGNTINSFYKQCKKARQKKNNAKTVADEIDANTDTETAEKAVINPQLTEKLTNEVGNEVKNEVIGEGVNEVIDEVTDEVKSEVKKKNMSSRAKSRVHNIRIIRKTLRLPNSEAQYCHGCSSIFDTDSCQYCVRKFKLGKKKRNRTKKV